MSHAPPTSVLWISFTAVVSLPTNTSVAIQVSRGKSRRDVSPILKPDAADGHFDSPLRCAIQIEHPPSFVLHILSADTVIFSPISSIPFDIDIPSITRTLSDSDQQTAKTCHVDLNNGVTLHFQPTLTEPADPHSDDLSDAPDDVVIASDLDSLDFTHTSSAHATTTITTTSSTTSRVPSLQHPPAVPLKSLPGKVDASFSSVSEEDYPNDSSPRVTRRVSFNSRVAEIPTTEKLQRDIDTAARDRSQLWHGVSDIVTQLSVLRREMRALETRLQAATSKVAQNQATQLSLPLSPLTPHNTSIFSSSLAPTPSSILTPSSTPTPSPTPKSSSAISFLTQTPTTRTIKRRRAILDGDMIAEAYGDKTFNVKGIELALDYYAKRDLPVVALVSQTILQALPDSPDSENQRRRVSYLRQQRLVSLCPSLTRKSNFLLQYAFDHDAVIVSNAWLNSQRSLSSEMSPSQNTTNLLLDAHVTPFMFIAGKFVPEHNDGEISNLSNSSQSSSPPSKSRFKRCATF